MACGFLAVPDVGMILSKRLSLVEKDDRRFAPREWLVGAEGEGWGEIAGGCGEFLILIL
jgi:hypothetical protein